MNHATDETSHVTQSSTSDSLHTGQFNPLFGSKD